MKEAIRKIKGLDYTDEETKKNLILDFIISFWDAVFRGDFYWAMSDSKEAFRLYGFQEIGWFNSKTEEFRALHPDAQDILLKKILWSSKAENFDKVVFDIKWPETSRQLLCIEMKLKTSEYTLEENFYLKIGMIPVWNEDYSKVIDYQNKPVVDFHD